MDQESGIDSIAAADPNGADKRPMERDEDTETDSNASVPCVKRRAYRRQQYREAWTREFSPWLKKCENDPYKGTCVACNKDIWAGRHDLVRHKNTLLHSSNMKHMHLVADGIETDVVEAEVRFVLDLVEHGRSFHSSDHLAQMLRAALPESNIAKNILLKRSKISAIIKNVINKSIIEKSSRLLKDKVFSVFVAESTDVSGVKNLCILARYLHEGKKETYLLDFLQIKDVATDNLYKCFQHSLNKHSLSVKNVVGICVDNANDTLGRHNSLVSRLLKDNKEVAVFSCLCYSVHLIAYLACDCLPSYVENFLNLIYGYSSRCPKRQRLLEDTQNTMRISRQNVPQPCRTRWLAMSECVHCIIEQWDTLLIVFKEANIKDNSPTADTIFELLNCLYTKAYLYFMDYVLNMFKHLSSLFESSKMLIHCFIPECARFLRILALNFLNINFTDIDNLCKIDIFDESNLLPLEAIHIGDNAKTIIEDIRSRNSTSETNEKIQLFYSDCRSCYQCAFQEIVKRIPWNEPFLKSLDFLEPSTTLNLQAHKNQLDHVFDKFKSKLNKAEAKNEWFLLTGYFSESEKQNLLKLDVTTFWNDIGKIEDFSNRKLFANISKVANLCLSLPHSDAEIEQFLSLINEIKTKDRNRLKPETVAALGRIRLDLINTNSSCFNYKIDNNILKHFKGNIYKNVHVDNTLKDILVTDDTTKSDSDC